MELLEQQDTIEVVSEERNSAIELVFYPKGADGKPLGSAKTVTGTPFQVWRAWMNGNGEGRVKNQKRKTLPKQKKRYKQVVPTGLEAENLLKEAAVYAEKKQISRDNKGN